MNKVKYFYLYKTTNLLNDKYYVGMHTTYNINDGYLGSGKRLKYSLKKYGIENFKFEIIEFFNNKEELIKAETLLINEELLNDEFCMNLRIGGIGGFYNYSPTKEQMEKSKNTQNILRENDKEWVDRKFDRMSKSLKKVYEDGRREKFYFFDWSGRKHSDETKSKISEKLKVISKGEGNSQYGTCWITKEGENKKIKKSELDNFLSNGWIKGRIINKV